MSAYDPSFDGAAAMIYWPSFLIVLATALLACVSVPVAYVVWIRLVGLEPTVAKRAAALSRTVRILFAIVLGFVLGGTLQFVPSIYAGLALVTMVSTSVFAGLLLFEFVTHRGVHYRWSTSKSSDRSRETSSSE